MTEGVSAARQETFHFLLVMTVFHYFQTNSVNKRNKGYSTLVVWGNCFRSLPNLINFAQLFPEPAIICL